MQDISSQLNGRPLCLVLPILPIIYYQLLVRFIRASSNHPAANAIKFYQKGKFRNHEEFAVFILAPRLCDLLCISSQHDFQCIHSSKRINMIMSLTWIKYK